MKPEKKRAWRNRIAGGIATAGLSLAIVGAISEVLGLTSLISSNLINNAILAVLSMLLVYIFLNSTHHEHSLDRLTKQVESINQGKITGRHLQTAILERVDEKLRPMFHQHLGTVIAEITKAYESQTVEFSDPLLFKSYYLAVLEAFPPRATLIATSLPLKQYFWDGLIEERMGQFHSAQGSAGH